MTDTTTQTIKVDPASVLFFAINGIRGWTESMDAAIEAKDVDKLTEAIEKLWENARAAKRAIKEGALK